MSPLVLGIVTAGAMALALSALFLLTYGFERFVGLRYLRRGRTSAVAGPGLVVAAAVIALGLVVLSMGREGSRAVETVGVVLTLSGGLGAMLFVLLRIFSVFTTVSTMGVVLGVASLVVVLAVTSGFEREFLRRVLVTYSDAVVMLYGEAATSQEQTEYEREAEAIRQKLAGLPGLQGTSKFVMTAGEVMIGKSGASFKGVELPAGAAQLEGHLEAGRAADLGQPARCPGLPEGEHVGRIILGAELARQVKAKVGDCVPMLVPFGAEGGDPASFTFKVVGLSRIGFHEYDSRFSFVPMEDLRWIGNARQLLFGVELRFDDPRRALKIEREVRARLGEHPPVRVLDWLTLNNNLFVALNMQKVIISLFLVIIIVVAASNIIAALTMIVLSKVREIAILGSMGARTRAVLRVFVSAGTFIGFVGTGLGLLYGMLVCAMIAAYRYPLDPKVYMIAQLPVRLDPLELLAVAASTQLICFLATVYPAVRASRLRIVDGLRGV